MRKLVILIVFFAQLSLLPMSAQLPTTGTEFWFGFMENSNDGPDDALLVTITSTQAASGTIEIPGQSWSESFYVNPNASVVIEIPNAIGEVSSEQFADDRGIHVQSDVPVQVYAANYALSSADASRILPNELIGTKYIAACYGGLNSSPSQLLIVATENDTEIQISPSVTTAAGNAAGVAFTIQLEAGECYRLVASGTGDLTGTSIMATSASGKCRPFAVFGGAICANVPASCFQACDHLYEQLYDLDKWGNKYIAGPFNFDLDPSYSVTAPRYTYRVLASENGTNVMIDDVTAIVLQAGEFQEFNNETEPHYIQSDRPIMVMQYMQGISCGGNGDPAMVLLDDLADMTTHATVFAPNIGAVDAHYLSVVIPAAGLGNFTLDGSNVSALLFEPIGEQDAFWLATFDISSGQHELHCNAGFNGMLFGHATDGVITASYALGLPVSISPEIINFEQTLCTNAAASLTIPTNYTNPRWFYANDPGAIISTQATLTLSAPIQNAVYELYADDVISGCVDTFFYSVESPDPIPIVITQDQLSVCSFEEVVLTAHAEPQQAMYTYSWLPSAMALDETGASVTVQAEESVDYEVTVSTPSGCGQTTASITVLVNQGDISSFGIVEENLRICQGQSVDLHLETERVVWRDNFDPAISWGDWESILNGVESSVCGTVSGNGLYFNDGFPREAITVPMDLSGNATVYFSLKIANGTAPCDDAEPGDNVTLAYSVAGGPWVTLQTFYESAYPDFTEIVVILPPAACNPNTRLRWRQSGSYTFNQDNWVLENAYVGRIATTAFAYAWSPASGLSSSVGSSVTASPGESVWYEVTTSDPATGCDYIDSVWIDVGQPFTLSMSPDETLCTPQSIELSAEPDQAGTYTYAWSPTAGMVGVFSANPTATITQTATYAVEAQSEFGCTALGSVTITLGSTFEMVIEVSDDSLCAGDTVQLTAVLSGQTQDIDLLWSGEPTIDDVTAASIAASPQQNVTITCLAEQAATGCAVTETIDLFVTPVFIVNVIPDLLQTCQATGTPILATATATEPVEWSWEPASFVFDPSASSTTLISEQSGTITATATTASGCAAFDVMLVEVSPLITNLGQDTGLCIGQSAILSVDWPQQYEVQWSNGETANAISVDLTGTYDVLVTAPNGCTSRDTIVVTVFDFPELDLGPDTSACDGDEVRLQAGDPGLDYIWNTGQLSREIFVSEEGIYSVEITNGYCVSQDTIVVDFHPLPTNPFMEEYEFCFDASDELLFLDAKNQGSFYVWDNDSISRRRQIFEAGDYQVTITSAEGCSSTFETSVVQECIEALYVPNSFTPDGDGINDVWLVYGVNIVNYHLQLFNRLGEMFYESRDLNTPWLGQRHDGSAYVDSEVYDYIITYQKILENGELSPEQIVRGFVVLIR